MEDDNVDVNTDDDNESDDVVMREKEIAGG